ncbi:MAG: hypothetical protein QOK28_121 [Actinomycetota bacterium]|jgi:plastocyanin
MKRAVLAALLFVAAGAVVFDAPAHASTGWGATMSNSGSATQPFKFETGDCNHASGDGNFTIHVGDEITWRNCTQAAHTVTANDSSFDSGNISSGGSYSHTFSAPADAITYHCSIHSYMTGTIKVTGESSTTQTTPTTQATTTPTTAKATTTTKPTTTTTVANTTTSDDLNGVFAEEPSTEPTTTVFSTDTTRALGTGGDEGTSAGVVAGLILGLGAIGTAVALVIRRMRAGTPPI